jgi:hypothetical protein
MRLTYAITPPNQATSKERRHALAELQSARISALPIDALLVYDVQDEAERNGAPRPFSFMPKLDPLRYAFDELQVGELPRVVYRALVAQSESSLRPWLERVHASGGRAVFVGAPSRNTHSALTPSRALSLARSHAPGLACGGVLISERHTEAGTEDARAWAKVQHGCSFFVSQTVWSVNATKRLLLDLQRRAEQANSKVPPILLTSSPCGSPQTLQFLEWLGVDVAPSLKRELSSAKDMLQRSVALATDLIAELNDFALERGLRVGFNVESVTSRAAEVEASAELVIRVHRLLRWPPVYPNQTDEQGNHCYRVGSQVAD